MPGFVLRPAVQAVDHVPEVRGRGGMAEDVHFRLRKAAMADLSLLNKVLISLDAGSLAAAQVFEFRVFDDEIIGKAFVEDGRNFLGRVMQPGIINLVHKEANFFASIIVRRSGHEFFRLWGTREYSAGNEDRVVEPFPFSPNGLTRGRVMSSEMQERCHAPASCNIYLQNWDGASSCTTAVRCRRYSLDRLIEGHQSNGEPAAWNLRCAKSVPAAAILPRSRAAHRETGLNNLWT